MCEEEAVDHCILRLRELKFQIDGKQETVLRLILGIAWNYGSVYASSYLAREVALLRPQAE